MGDDDRKTVLITGCSPGGIGHSLALYFHEKGARVFATARSKTTLTDLADKGIETLDIEVTKAASIKAAHDEISSRTGGKLDYLVNNAGRNYTVPGLDIDIDEARLTFETNVIAVMAMCQAFAPLLIKAKGTIVQIGSVAGIMPFVFGSVYNATKAALHQYSNTLRVELAPFGVEVVTIVTGGVQSRIARADGALPEKSFYQPVDKEYEERVKYSQEGAMPNERYAARVVDQIWGKRGNKFHIWAGAKIWGVWFMTSFWPRSWQNAWFTRRFSLWKLRRA